MILGIVEAIHTALSNLADTLLDVNIIFFIGIGFLLLMSIFFFVRARTSYEYKLERATDKLNDWLFKNQQITEQNLVEFNNMMKSRKTPKILRKYWQQYILYRDKHPSEYMSSYNCIDKPLKTSIFNTSVKNFKLTYMLTAFITFFFSILTFDVNSTSILYNISRALITSAIILVIGVILTIALRAMQDYNLATLYQTFNVFNRYIDKASSTIPSYVDFEVLFTEKEIKNGIPILGEYLEKRALKEQEELEEAQRNAISHEEYDFSALGVDDSLVLERAMKESELYLNSKQRLLIQIEQFESEISTLKKNYENTSKDYQRKLQASKENMDRLRQQLEESTNRIDINFIRKQQQDEVKKQELLEKDQTDATNKFNAEIKSITHEIDKRRAELEEKKQKVQDVMQSEYQTLSTKIYKSIKDDVEKTKNESIQEIINEKNQYAQAISYLKNEVETKNELILSKEQTIAELNARLNNAGYSQSVATTQVAEPVQEQTTEEPAEDGHYDNKGYYWFNNGTYYDDQNLYHDLEGNVYDADGNLLKTNQLVEKEFVTAPVETVKPTVVEQSTVTQEPTVQEIIQKVEETPKQEQSVEVKEEPAVEVKEEQVVEQEQPKVEENTTSAQQETQEQSQQEQPDGHYDNRGYYWYNNGTYYDADNNYHDTNGNVYDENGNLIKTNQPVEKENQPVEANQQTPENAQTEIQEETTEKRKAGRPKKETSDQDEDKPKRSVGRPKKDDSDDTDTTPKRRAGRPKKEDSDEEANKPKRSVGRPKKTDDVPASAKRRASRG